MQCIVVKPPMGPDLRPAEWAPCQKKTTITIEEPIIANPVRENS